MRTTLLLVAATLASCSDRAPHRPNVLLIGMDTLRADALGFLGAADDATPHLDALAADGVVFEDATTAAPWTLPSFASILTGLYPEAHGVKENTDRLASGIETVAETLAAAGYDTAAFTGGGHVGTRNGLDAGFATFDTETTSRKFEDRIPPALEWLARDRERPWFLFVHAYDVHTPYAPTERPSSPDGYTPPDSAFATRLLDRLETSGKADAPVGAVQVAALTIEHPRQRAFRQAVFRWSATLAPSLEQQWAEAPEFERELAWVRANYAAEVTEMDRSLGRLFSALRADGQLDDTLVVLVSDHGEAFMEHGRLDHTHVDEEVARVPLAIIPPGGRAPGAPARLDTPVRTIDIAPTVLELCGLPARGATQGRSLAPGMRGEAIPPMPVCCFHHNVGRAEPEISIRHAGWKMILGGTLSKHYGGGRLFHLASDPGERTNLFHQKNDRLKDLARLLRGVRRRSASLADLFDPETATLDEAARRELIELGYVGQVERTEDE